VIFIDNSTDNFKNYLTNFIDRNHISSDLKMEYYQSTPQKLYKFRVFNENNLNAFEKDYIWLSLAKDFTDKTDSTIDFKFTKQKNKIEKLVEKELPALVLDQFKKELYFKSKINPAIFDTMTLDDLVNWVKEYKYKTSGNFKIGKFRERLRQEGVNKKTITKFEKEIPKLEEFIHLNLNE